jgi:urea transporter
MAKAITPFYDPYLKGIGQIMLQENSLTGLLFLIGILINSPLMAAGTLLGAVVGTLTATLLKFDQGNINSGLYGFNAALVGIAMLVFFDATMVVWISIVVLSAISAILMNICLKNKIPIFTFPFIVLVWISLYLFHNVAPIEPPSEADLAGLIDETTTFNLANFGFGFGEVIFQGSFVSGLVFFLAVYLSSPNAALWGLAGTFAGGLFAFLLVDQFDAVQQGWFTFNSVLCAITFSGVKRRNGIFVLLAVFLSVVIENLMMSKGLTFLTFPFVLATWLTLVVRDVLLKKVLPVA